MAVSSHHRSAAINNHEDRVQHKGLLSKLSLFGFHSVLLSRMSRFLIRPTISVGNNWVSILQFTVNIGSPLELIFFYSACL